MSNYNYYNIDWKQEVRDYKEQYDDMESISEYIDSLLPQYYGDIYQTYHDVIGTPIGIIIQKYHVGQALWEIMNLDIFHAYYGKFIEALNELEKEEE